MKVNLSDVEQTFKELFEMEEGLVSSIDSVYEKKDGFLKLVISIHGLTLEDTSIIHTKFIFKCDENKSHLIDNTFSYLYDINCIFEHRSFTSAVDLKNKIKAVIDSNDFGNDIQILSDFVSSPAMFLNHYMRRENISDYSIFDVEYSPKFKIVACDKITFDFKININDNYNMDLSIAKVDKKDDNDVDIYKFQFKFMDEIMDVETDTMLNFHYFVGSNIAKFLDKKLKNKD